MKFIHFGGQSGPIGAVATLTDCLYSYEDLWAHDLSVGSGAIVVMDDSVNVVDYLVHVAAFLLMSPVVNAPLVDWEQLGFWNY